MTTETEISLERRVRAPASTVFKYLTDGKKWALWQGVETSIDARPGGIFRMNMANGMVARGQFLIIEPDRRVVFTWGWIDQPGVPPGSSTVEIDLVEDGTSTIVKLRHTGLPPGEIPFHQMGWAHYLPRLESAASGIDPGPDSGPG